MSEAWETTWSERQSGVSATTANAAFGAAAGLSARGAGELPPAATAAVQSVPAISVRKRELPQEPSSETAVYSAVTRATRFELRQQWEGTVVEIGEDSFVVNLKDLTDPTVQEESSELFLEDVGESDRPLLELGAIFYWSIGYEDTPRGREKKSIIRFRRLPGWTARGLAAVKARASELSDWFVADSDHATATR